MKTSKLRFLLDLVASSGYPGEEPVSEILPGLLEPMSPGGESLTHPTCIVGLCGLCYGFLSSVHNQGPFANSVPVYCWLYIKYNYEPSLWLGGSA